MSNDCPIQAMSIHPKPSRDRGVVLDVGANSYFPHMVGGASSRMLLS